ncbi:hypothetical protein [Actinomadura rubrisoli]|uniref:Uncharacterized protein n=1 Tax=Actinomadura rubrisoli TaxID=2530368 RepID=A0A4R5BSU7_9ACTN|nr:hypothetical protein [Actinomadura rubrisoli]TDD88350.1 hypothetical protein E1298_15170 [Actinomadura rubrisoli]
MSTYPQIAAGQRITAALLTSMLPTEIVKAANTDRVNNTFSADPELTIALDASAVYRVEFDLLAGGTTTADIQTRWAVPAAASGLKSVIGPGSTAAEGNADNVAMRTGVHGFTTTVVYSGVRNATGNLFRIWETAVLTTAGAGTLSLEWAQATTNATASRISAGSLLRVKRIG